MRWFATRRRLTWKAASPDRGRLEGGPSARRNGLRRHRAAPRSGHEGAVFPEAVVDAGRSPGLRSDTPDEFAWRPAPARTAIEGWQVLGLEAAGRRSTIRPAPPLISADSTTLSATATTGAPAGADSRRRDAPALRARPDGGRRRRGGTIAETSAARRGRNASSMAALVCIAAEPLSGYPLAPPLPVRSNPAAKSVRSRRTADVAGFSPP